MSIRTPDHWLWRLDASDWLAAARRELELGRDRVDARRAAITHARRGAGMALNGLLVAFSNRGADDEACVQAWGRSYVDHLRALARGDDAPLQLPLPPELGPTAADLLQIPVVPGGNLVQLARVPGGEVMRALELAGRIVELAAAIIESSEH